MGRRRLTDEERNARRELERLRSRLRRDKLRVQLKDDILAEASHASTVRILEYPPIALQNDVQTPSEEHGGASGYSASAGLSAARSQDGSIVHGTVCNLPHNNMPFWQSLSHPNGGFQSLNSGAALDSRNTVTCQDTTDTAHQGASAGSPSDSRGVHEASFARQRRPSSSKRVQLHRDRKRKERLRQYSLEADHSRGCVRVVSPCVNVAIPQQPTVPTPSPATIQDIQDHNDVYDEWVGEVCIGDPIHEQTNQQRPHDVASESSGSDTMAMNMAHSSQDASSEEKRQSKTQGGRHYPDTLQAHSETTDRSGFSSVVRDCFVASVPDALYIGEAGRVSDFSDGFPANNSRQPSTQPSSVRGFDIDGIGSANCHGSDGSLYHDYVRAFTGTDNATVSNSLGALVAVYEKTFEVFFNLECNCELFHAAVADWHNNRTCQARMKSMKAAPPTL